MWHPLLPLVPVYYQKLWKFKYSEHYEYLCKVFLAPLYKLVFNKPCSIFVEESLQALDPLGDRYIERDGNYLWLYGCTSAPHILPKHVLDILVLMEVAYKTAKFGANVKLKEHKKGLFPTCPLTIGVFTLLDLTAALTHEDDMDLFKLMPGG